ncbi:MAG: hypothetical protein WCP28_18065 [Actinomycetes bacterium]
MRPRLLLDTCVLIAAANPDQDQHDVCAKLIRDSARGLAELAICSGVDYDQGNATPQNRHAVDSLLAANPHIAIVDAAFTLDVSQLDAPNDQLLDDGVDQKATCLKAVLGANEVDLHHAVSALKNRMDGLVTMNTRQFVRGTKRERLLACGLVVFTPTEILVELLSHDVQARMDATAHIAYEVGQCIDSAVACRRKSAKPDGDPVVQNACLEASLLHARVLVEFLLEAPSRTDDMRIEQFGPAWTPRSEVVVEAAERLRAIKPVMNKHLAHLTWTRIFPVPEPDWFFIRIAEDILTIVDDWASHLAEAYTNEPWMQPVMLLDEVAKGRRALAS